jgi:cytochrome c oxidase subunit 2
MGETAYGWWLPINISTHGGGIDRILDALHWFMGLLFVGWGVFFIYCLIRFRRRANPKAQYELVHARASKYVEIAVVIIEAILLVGFSMPVWAHFKHEFPAEKDALVVRVVAEQFAWNVHYPGKDGQFGRTAPQFISSSNLLGLDPDDPDGRDDINAVNQLHFPVNKPVIVRLSTKDVIHSFKIPVMRLTQDAIPGTEVKIWFEASRTGQFDLACAQLCGLGHYRMRGAVSVDTPEAFARWMEERQSEVSGTGTEY